MNSESTALQDYIQGARCAVTLAELSAAYEAVRDIPAADRLTFSSQGGYYIRHNVTDEQVLDTCENGLADLGLSADCIYDVDGCHYDDIVSSMRSRLLTKELNIGEAVLFVSPESPYIPGCFDLMTGTINEIDAESKTCTIHTEFISIRDVPLHYVLGRSDAHTQDLYYGYKCCQPLFGYHPELAKKYLADLGTAYEQANQESSAMVRQSF